MATQSRRWKECGWKQDATGLRLTISGDERTVVVTGSSGAGTLGWCSGTFALDGNVSTVQGQVGAARLETLAREYVKEAAAPGKPRAPATAKASMREDALTIDFEQPEGGPTEPPRRWTCRFSASGTALDVTVNYGAGQKEIKQEFHWVREKGAN